MRSYRRFSRAHAKGSRKRLQVGTVTKLFHVIIRHLCQYRSAVQLNVWYSETIPFWPRYTCCVHFVQVVLRQSLFVCYVSRVINLKVSYRSFLARQHEAHRKSQATVPALPARSLCGRVCVSLSLSCACVAPPSPSACVRVHLLCLSLAPKPSAARTRCARESRGKARRESSTARPLCAVRPSQIRSSTTHHTAAVS